MIELEREGPEGTLTWPMEAEEIEKKYQLYN